MNQWRQRVRILVEGVAIARAQPLPTLVTGTVVAAVCGVILATTGQTAAAEAEVLRGIDDAGTTIIVIEDREGRGRISPDTVARISALDAVKWVVGFGKVSDVRNAALGRASAPVPARVMVGDLPEEVETPLGAWAPGEAIVSQLASDRLGLIEPAGSVVGTAFTADIVGNFVSAPPLDFLEGSVLVANAPSTPQREELFLRSVHVRVSSVRDVVPVTAIVRSVVNAESQEYTVSTPQQLVDLREVVADELGETARQLMLVVLGVGLAVVAVTLYGAVVQRRRDFGRRRALGASRSTLVMLVLVQSLVASGVGATLGTVLGLVAVSRLAGALPSATFTWGVLMLAIVTALVAAIPPAVVAAVRDPVRILRVP